MTRRPEIDFARRAGPGALRPRAADARRASSCWRWPTPPPRAAGCGRAGHERADHRPAARYRPAGRVHPAGPRALGVRPDIVAGLRGGVHRRDGGRRGPLAPARRRRRQRSVAVAMGGARRVPHLVVMLYAAARRARRVGGGRQRARNGTPRSAWRPAWTPSTWATSSRSASPTASASPRLDWGRELSPDDAEQAEYSNLIPLGEVLLGYPNAYGRYTERPLIDPVGDRARRRPAPGGGRGPTAGTSAATARTWCSGSSIRTCGASGSSSTGRRARGPRNAGGWPRRWSAAPSTGEPLVPLGDGPDRRGRAGTGGPGANQFTYAADPDGHRCPLRRPRPARQPAHGRSARPGPGARSPA